MRAEISKWLLAAVQCVGDPPQKKTPRHAHPSGRRGRQPFPLDLMLRIHLLQVAYNLSDPRMEDLLLENSTARKFVGLNLMDRTPDESTILQFRHLLEKHQIDE